MEFGKVIGVFRESKKFCRLEFNRVVMCLASLGNTIYAVTSEGRLISVDTENNDLVLITKNFIDSSSGWRDRMIIDTTSVATPELYLSSATHNTISVFH
jgi:hypothetical protein